MGWLHASSASVTPASGILPSISVLARLNLSELRPLRLPSGARSDGRDVFESKPALTPPQMGRITQHHVLPRAPEAAWPTPGANPLQACPRRRTHSTSEGGGRTLPPAAHPASRGHAQKGHSAHSASHGLRVQCHGHTGDSMAESPDPGTTTAVQAHFLPSHLGKQTSKIKKEQGPASSVFYY